MTQKASLIDVKHYTYTYEDEERAVLQDISFSIHEGEFILMVGPSGCGKSTLCQALNGIVPHVLGGEAVGEIIVDGKNVLESEVKDMSESIGMVFQDADAQLCNIYVEDEVAFAPENLRVEPDEIQRRIKDCLNKVGMSGYESRKVFELSGGQKQKVGIASVLSMKPKILILDNATANLDPQATKDIFTLLKELHEQHGYTIMVVENKIDDLIHLADRIMVMEQGSFIANGDPRTIIREYGKQLMEMGIWIPEVSELAFQLEKMGYSFKHFPITVEDAYHELKYPNQPFLKPRRKLQLSEKASDEPDILTVNNLNYLYPNGTKALNNISFSIKKGDFVAILGTNGSGKTTLIKHLMGIIKPPKGKIFLRGEDIAKRSLHDMTKDISYVFQNPEHQFVTDQVLEESIYSQKMKLNLSINDEVPNDIIESGLQSLKQFNLYEAKDKNPFMLSGGEKRRLSVVSSIASEQEIIILDEPTTGLDFASATRLLKLCKELNEQGKTIIMINHDIRLICRWVRSALIMQQGHLIFNGDIHDVFQNDEICEKASLIEPPISKLAKKLNPGLLTESVISINQFMHGYMMGGEESGHDISVLS
ncbi:ABC transporter ATP-binding protein [Terrilactibacillus laevilacticus]|uniref:ABC transporter ATP-binding protein n=1 Tax=Terrilactibacillus laevilacticus TaxID=1380157 RepID=A0ABW5PLD0_9BACI|nr:ABC transporter ATP-binding protein [Terrilactibacillus laevilacticus]